MLFRQVHLDFHTSEKIDGIGKKFNKKQFQEMLKLGHVNSITLFSKCHHGWAYHPTEANEIHPGLDFDLLGAQLEACKEIGVNAPIYLSAGFDEKITRVHPEWLARKKDEKLYWIEDFSKPGYHRLCMNSPYLDYLLEQIKEVCIKYDPVGIFLDIVDVLPCYCQNCIKSLIDEGMDPYDEKNIMWLANRTHMNYLKKVREAIDSVKPGLPVFHNSGHVYRGNREREEYNSHYELESLPTGGWGYDHFPLSARYVWQLGKEYLGMTGKFHLAWGEFGGYKHPNALRFEVSLAAAHGAKSSIGDQMHPFGELDKATYSLIGKAYSELEQKEPWLDNVTPVADIGLLSHEAFNFMNEGYERRMSAGADNGSLRVLQEGNYLFDVLDIQSDFSKYKLLILPDEIRINQELKHKLNEFTHNGGKILATGKSGLWSDKNEFALDFGAEYIGENSLNPNYIKPDFEVKDLDIASFICYCQCERIEKTNGNELAKNENSFFNRTVEHFCSHKHSPAAETYNGCGAVMGKDGIYVPWHLFSEYATIGSLHPKNILHHFIELLLKEKSLITTLPSQGIVTLMHQESENRYIAHLLYAPTVRRGQTVDVIEDLPDVCNTKLAVSIDKLIKRVYLAPECKDVEFTNESGYISVTIDKFQCHQMIVFEY